MKELCFSPTDLLITETPKSAEKKHNFLVVISLLLINIFKDKDKMLHNLWMTMAMVRSDRFWRVPFSKTKGQTKKNSEPVFGT